MTNQKRFITLKKYKGIRKDLLTNKYVATKSHLGHRFSKTFEKLLDAAEWARTPVESQERSTTYSDLFTEVWNQYIEEHVSTLETSSQTKIYERSKLFTYFANIQMEEFNPKVIVNFLLFNKDAYLKTGYKRRMGFTHELKILHAFFNWYKETVDYKFVNPVLKRHKQIGKIKDPVIKEKKMTPEELQRFFDALKERSLFWHDVALAQFYCASRIQEMAGLQKSSIDLQLREILIKDVVVWGKKKEFLELKTLPKNGEVRIVYLNDALLDMLKRRVTNHKCSYVFHIDGKPFTYREVQHNYTVALKSAGLYPKFSGTHFMRHSMATITRSATQSLELTQSITGHKDQRLVQHYARMDSSNNKEAQLKVQSYLENLASTRQCEQMRTKELLQ